MEETFFVVVRKKDNACLCIEFNGQNLRWFLPDEDKEAAGYGWLIIRASMLLKAGLDTARKRRRALPGMVKRYTGETYNWKELDLNYLPPEMVRV